MASLADATVGALRGAQLAVGALGRALAIAKELQAKHAIKQVDRFFSNTGVDVWKLFASDLRAGPFGMARRGVKLYSKRFTIEESFRDLENLCFGMGLTGAP